MISRIWITLQIRICTLLISLSSNGYAFLNGSLHAAIRLAGSAQQTIDSRLVIIWVRLRAKRLMLEDNAPQTVGDSVLTTVALIAAVCAFLIIANDIGMSYPEHVAAMFASAK